MRPELFTLKHFGYQVDSLNDASWISVKEVKDVKKVEALRRELDIGEAESIVLAQELGAGYLLIDEKKGRLIAKREGLTIIGLLVY